MTQLRHIDTSEWRWAGPERKDDRFTFDGEMFHTTNGGLYRIEGILICAKRGWLVMPPEDLLILYLQN